MFLLQRIFLYGLITTLVFITYTMSYCENWSHDNSRREQSSDIQSFKVNCISTVVYLHDSGTYGYNQMNIENYNIHVNLENPDENPFLEDVTFINKLTILDGYLVTLPKDIYNMTGLTTFKMSENKLRKINFNDFLALTNLKQIDLSMNKIMIIETVEKSSDYSNVQYIDISFNLVEAVPNNFVKRFTGLEHLNMSHNMISSVERHAFEGTVQLKTLDLSHNKLQEIGNIFAQLPKLIDLNYAASKNLQKLSRLVLDDNFITDINFKEFFETGIPELSIGGNLISCSVLANVKYSKMSEKFDRIVTSNILNFLNDNIDGIPCELKDKNNMNSTNISDDPKSNSSILMSLLKNAIDNNGKSVVTVIDTVNRNEKKIEQLIESTNSKLLNISNQLNDIENSLNNNKVNIVHDLRPINMMEQTGNQYDYDGN